MTQAVILAGGKGTRLADVAGGLPKPLVPVLGVPIVERQIRLLARYEIDEVFLTTGFGADSITERLGDARFGTRLYYQYEEQPLGTAGGAAALRGRLHEDFLVLYGDVLVHMDLARLLRFHRQVGAAATLVIHPNDHPEDSDLVSIDDQDRIERFHPKPRPRDGPDLRNLVSAGLYVLSPAALEFIEPEVEQDFIRDVFPRMLEAGAPLYGYRTTEYLKDMGTPDRLARVELDLESGIAELRHRDHARPTAFLDRDGVLNVEKGGVHEPRELELLPGVPRSVARLNRAGWLVAVVTNQPDVAKGLMSEGDVASVHRRLERRLGEEGGWLDELTYCPHHPEAGHRGERAELKISCGCRKPAPGMLEWLSARLPVDRQASAFVGDTWRDMALAHAFGLDAIGVLTGHALNTPPPEEHALASRPDVIVEDLPEAVSLLVDRDPGVEELTRRVREARTASQPPPCTVAVGGLSGVGKSVSIFRLRRELRGLGFESLHVRLDDWLVPAALRRPGSTLAERFRLDDLSEATARLARGEATTAPGYEPRMRDAGPPVPYDPAGVDVVILEGVPALLLDRLPPSCLRVHLDAPSEEERRRRVFRLYESRGVSRQQAATRLAERDEEHERVLSAAAKAHLRFTPAPFDTGAAGSGATS